MAAGDITTLAAVRSFLRITDANQTGADAQLALMITQASKAMHTHAGREFVPVNTGPLTRKFAYYGGGRLFMTPYDLQTVTSVVIDSNTDLPTTLTSERDYFTMPRNSPSGVLEHLELHGCEPPAKENFNRTRPWREVSVTGTWGFAAPPADIVAACNMLVAFWYRNQSTTPGQSLAGEGDRFGPVSMPSAVLQILASYRVFGFGYGA